MIKEVEVGELQRVSEVGKQFFEESQIPGKMDSEVFCKNWKVLIEVGMGKIYGVYQDGLFVGGLGALITPDLNDGKKVATEAFWFVSPQYRGAGIKLLLFFLNHAKEIGCERVIMVHLFNSHSEKLAKLYQNLGFQPVETHYLKNL